jgi:hypothetical protein
MLKNNTVKLNVGGKIFEARISTLIGSFIFKSMFEDVDDYSPHIFKHILSYLRDNEYEYPKNITVSLNILA